MANTPAEEQALQHRENPGRVSPLIAFLLLGAAGYVAWRVWIKKPSEPDEDTEKQPAPSSGEVVSFAELAAQKNEIDQMIRELGYTYPGTQSPNWLLFAHYYNQVAQQRGDADPESIPADRQDIAKYWQALKQVRRWIDGVPGTPEARWQQVMDDAGVAPSAPAG